MKVWTINKSNTDGVYYDPEGEVIEGSNTDGDIEVVEKAEYDKLKALLDAIVDDPSEEGDWECVKMSNLDAYRRYRGDDSVDQRLLGRKL